MFRFLFLGCLLVLCGCESTPIPDDYKGADAGRVVIGIGARSGTGFDLYQLRFRRAGETNGDAGLGAVGWLQSNLFREQAPDYHTDSEAGVVQVRSIPAGRYEVFTFLVSDSRGSWFPREEFSIPFVVRPRETVYLGNYRAQRVSGKNLFGMRIPIGAIFVVSDRMQADMEIARGKEATLGADATNATPRVEAIGSPLFIAP